MTSKTKSIQSHKSQINNSNNNSKIKIKVRNEDTHHEGKKEPVQCVGCFLPFRLELLLIIGVFCPQVLGLQLLKSGRINDQPPSVGVECVSIVHHGHVLLAHRLLGV